MTTAILSLGKAQKRIQSRIQTQIDSIEIPTINWKLLCIAGFFMSLMLLVFYVWQIGNLTKSYYLVSGYERQISKLSDENKNLQISFAENSFMEQAMVRMQELNFQKATLIKYVHVLDSETQTALANK
ncbi:MAG: hypothetical protein WC711_00785 [Candidatus Staskawiczbacteria bacterium]|jgi:hypothetical protein